MKNQRAGSHVREGEEEVGKEFMCKTKEMCQGRKRMRRQKAT